MAKTNQPYSREPSERSVWANFRDNELEWDAVKVKRLLAVPQHPLNEAEMAMAKGLRDSDEDAIVAWLGLPKAERDRIYAAALRIGQESIARPAVKLALVAMTADGQAVTSPRVTVEDVRAGRNMHLFRALPEAERHRLWGEAFKGGHPGAGEMALDTASEEGAKHDFLNTKYGDGIRKGLMGETPGQTTKPRSKPRKKGKR